MADEFAQYIVKTSPNNLGADEFDQYRVTPPPTTPPPEKPPSKWKQIGRSVANFVEPAVRPTLEYGGMAAGAALGVPEGPAGVVAGAGLGYAAGRQGANLYDQATGKGQPKPVLEGIAGAGKDFVEGTEMEMGGQVLGKYVQKIGQYFASKAPRLYESALKIPPSVPKEIRDKAVQTGLQGKYKPTEKDLNGLLKDIEQTNNAIAEGIAQAGKKGETVSTDEVLKRVEQLKEFYQNAPNPAPYLKELDDIKAGILEYRGKKIPIEKAQKIKQTVYALNKKHYGEMKGLEIEANKAIARGIKEEIVKQHPEIGDLNEHDSALINLEEVLERAVNRSRNYDVVKMGSTIMSVGGGVIGGAPGAAIGGIGKEIIDTPSIKARIAFAINKAVRMKSRRFPAYVAGKAVMTQND